MVYYILKNQDEYLKQINKGVFETVEHFMLAYKFSCEKSVLVFKEANKLDDFDVVEVRCL